MRIAGFSVRNSLLVNLASVLIVLAGVYSMMNLRREAFPPVDYDIVTVTTIYPGAPTEDVEKLITIPLEEEIKGVSGIDELKSSSDEGYSSIGIYIDPSVSDKDQVVTDIQRAVDRVTDLPADAEDPEVFELESKEFPVLEISISGKVSENTRRTYAEVLEDRIEDIKGVSSVRRIGWRDREFWVEVDPDKLRDYHVSVEEVMDALKTRNVTVPGGQLTTPVVEFNVRTTGEFQTAEEISEVVIRANDAGNALKIKDVAQVIDTFEDPSRIANINGERATAMVVVKTETGDAINIVREINEDLEAFKETLPEEISVTITNDFSYYVKRRLNVLKNNGIIGLILVLGILFLFLDPVPALTTAFGIPIAIFITFIVMTWMDISINLVSMLGLLLVLGMLVDDGIIVAENVYRHVENGMDPKEAAIHGTNEVAAPVIVTIFTTFAAFSPLLFMPDIIGKFIRTIPIVVIITLSASLLEAFIILPSHLSDFVGFFKKDNKSHDEKKWFKKIKDFYLVSIRKILRMRYVFVGGLVACFFFAVWIGFFKMNFVLFAGEGIEYFYVRAEAKKGTPLDRINELIAPVEDLIATLPDDELDSFRTYLGSIEEEAGFDPNAKRGTHLGQINVFLTPAQKRKRTPQEIVDDLRPKLEEVEGFEKLYFFLPKEGPPTGNPVEVGIRGEEFPVMQEIAEKFKNYLEQLPGVSDVNTSYDFGKKQLKINVDEEKAKKYYLTVGQIASTVRQVFKGGVATSIKPSKAEDEIDVLVRFPKSERDDLSSFDKILVPNRFNNLVPLKSVAAIEETEGVYLINHLEGKRVVYVTAQVDNKTATSLKVNQELQKQFKGIEEEYLGYTVRYSGEYEDQMETLKNLLISYFFALVIIFILLVAMFRSLIQPFIIMTAIPFGIIGVILAFWIHDIILPGGRPLNFFAMMGLVGLTGIVVNDSIVLVDFVNKLRKKGKERRESLIEAGAMRLRPVIMTSVTTIGGLVSVAYGIGGGDPFLKPMALAIVWGLVFSTFLTLAGIPCIYAIIDDIALKIFHRGLVEKENHKETPA